MRSKGGAPIGNQNARKHGLYSRILDEDEKREFALAASDESFDEEIALLRVKISSFLRRDPDNLALIWRAIETLRKLLIAKQKAPHDKADAYRNAAEYIVAAFGLSPPPDSPFRRELPAEEDEG